MNSSIPVRARRAKGSAMMFALVIITFVSVVLSAAIGFIGGQVKYASKVTSREQEFQIAESGIHFYRWYLSHVVDGRTASQIEAFWSSSDPLGKDAPYEAEYIDPVNGAVGRYRITVVPPDPGSTIVTVTSEGWSYKDPSDTRTIVVRFRRPSWSESAVLANDFMRFGEGTEVYGKIHSNQGIRFDGVAHNVISSAVSSYDDPDHANGNEFGVHTHVNAPPSTGVNNSFRAAEAPPNTVPDRSDVFEAGREFPMPSVDFSGVLGDLNYMKSAAQSGTGNSRYFGNLSHDVGRRIILKTNGTYDTCRVAAADFTPDTYVTTSRTNAITNYRRTSSNTLTCSTCSGSCLQNFPIPSNGVIFVEDNVWLSGQVSGKKVTIVAADVSGGPAPSVYIGNDIRYSSYDGSDIIGVIAQNDIEIIRDSESDLRIDAALLAQQGRVGREYYNGMIRSVITVYGAIATNRRYGFAYTDGTGYQTRDLYYDNSLLYYPPPYFPTGTQYEMDLWEEQ